VQAHFFSEHLEGVTLLNHFNARFFGLSQARIGDHHKPLCGSHSGLTHLPRELRNNVRYYLFLDDTKCR
jgi:hypothetical protein